MRNKMKRSIESLLWLLVATSMSMAQAVPAQVVSAAPEHSSSATGAPAGAGTTTPQLQDRYPRYRISPSDQFDVNFELSPEFNQLAVEVQPDGFVNLRSVGDIYVAGQTVPELTETLRVAYGKMLHDPLISIVLKDFQKPFFIADGQVGRPGKYDLRGDTTLTEAIAIAGGFTDNSRHSQVLLFRRISDQWTEARIINVKKMEKAGNLKEDPVLHPGDMLFVPKSTYSKIEKYIPNANVGTYIPLVP
jgi:polysaccharide export outer membrane protein